MDELQNVIKMCLGLVFLLGVDDVSQVISMAMGDQRFVIFV